MLAQAPFSALFSFPLFIPMSSSESCEDGRLGGPRANAPKRKSTDDSAGRRAREVCEEAMRAARGAQPATTTTTTAKTRYLPRAPSRAKSRRGAATPSSPTELPSPSDPPGPTSEGEDSASMSVAPAKQRRGQRRPRPRGSASSVPRGSAGRVPRPSSAGRVRLRAAHQFKRGDRSRSASTEVTARSVAPQRARKQFHAGGS